MMFEDQGFVVLRGVLPPSAIDLFMDQFLSLTNEIGRQSFDSPHTADFARYLDQNRPIQSEVYDAIRKPGWLETLAAESTLVGAVRDILGTQVGVLRKIVFRIDVPFDTTQLAVWHQDHFYVRGNLDTVTAWIPMDDTPYLKGCLQVMPASHKLGPLRHDTKVLGKRDMPAKIFDREIRLIELNKGDVLLFHSCLLHSSGINLSEVTRFSVQARYTRLTDATDPSMGGVTALPWK